MIPSAIRSDAASPADSVSSYSKFQAEQARSAVFLMSNSLETGGSERQFAMLAQSLDRERFDVRLGCIMREGRFLEGLQDVAEFELGGNLYGLRSMRTRGRLARHLKGHRIAIAHAFDFYTNLTLIPAARWAQVPVVIGSQRQLGDLLTWKQERAQAAVLRWCDAVVCNSCAAARRLAELGLKESRLIVIENGLPPESFAETAPALPREGNELRVGMIARMNTPAKNHRLFLGMAARLRARFPAALQFVLAGDGPLRPELERQAEALGLGGHILFLGDRRDVPAVLAALDVSVLPSSSESLSNVILESMAAGVAVVASRVGGNCELLTEDRGVLVAPNDEEALAAAVERLLSDSGARANMGRNGRAFVRANFTIDRMRRRHEELYQELMEKKRGRARPVQRIGIDRTTFKERSRTRVTIVAASPRYVGGQSVQAALLLRSWRNDTEVDAKFVPVDPTFPFLLKWVGHIPLLRTLIRQPIYLFQLWRGLKGADIAHIFSASYLSFLVAVAPALWVARQRGAKTLVHYHSGEARDHLQRFPGARRALRRADRLAVPSGYLGEVFREFRLEAQAIPNAVDRSQFAFRVRRVLRPHLICTRGFHPYYCVDLVVRAFAEVQKMFPEARLDLVGAGPLEKEIQALVQGLKLTGVKFKGAVAHDEIGRLYDQADIFINASKLDNMPVSILEAFASGLPVVSTEAEGMRYLVENGRTGLLSAPGDARALAENVLRVLRDPELAEGLALNARRETERYSWDVVREQWSEVYRGMTSGTT
jgi:L-malate glycosyltransferase